MFEDDVLERHELVREDFESPSSVPLSYEPGTRSDRRDIVARIPSPQQSPTAKEPAAPVRPEAAQPQVAAKESRLSFLYRRPVVSAIGAVLLAFAMAGGYLYLDYAKHFESTDDAFIAARQSTLAPKVAAQSPLPTTSMSPPAR